MIQIPKEEIVDINLLKTDGNNPNITTDEEKKAIKLSIEKFGFMIPIITDKDYLIADGQQRLEVAKDMGLKQVKIVKLPLKDVDRRILRQVLNKLRGTHERDLDLEEFQRIDDAGEIELLKELLPEEDFDLKVKEKLEDNPEEVENLGKLTVICPKCGHRFERK